MTCAVEGCDRDVRARGWCGKHYQRWAKWGDPTRTDAYPLLCPVCLHPERIRVEAMYLDGVAVQELAEMVGAKASGSVYHHLRSHTTLVPLARIGGRRGGRPCSVCHHPAVAEIDRLLVEGEVSGKEIARRFDLPFPRIYHHKRPDHQRRRAEIELARLAALKASA